MIPPFRAYFYSNDEQQAEYLQSLATFYLYNSLPNSRNIDMHHGMTTDAMLHGRSLFRDTAWNTLCLPFDLADFSGTPLDIAIVMTLQSSSFDSSSGTLFLYFEPVTAIEAGKPYIVKWTQPDKEIRNPVFMDVTISSPVKSIKTDAVTFCDVFDPFPMAANDRTKLYLSGDNTLYYPDNEMTVNAFRAYFQLADGITAGDPSSGSGVRAFVMNFGNVGTGIVSLIPAPSPVGEGSDYYTLDGRRLSSKPTQRGIYISNKRIIIK